FIFDSTKEIESGRPGGALDGQHVALLFYQPSTRTYSSFEIAAERLGCRTTGFSSPEKSSVAKGETLHDTIRMYEGYGVDCIVMRHNLMGAARFASDLTKGAVVSGGEGPREQAAPAIAGLSTEREDDAQTAERTTEDPGARN